jgi:glycolate oxidase iron-sulfur subunit
MRRNIDAWWPLIERGEVEAIVMNASGCGATVKEYGHHLAGDAAYAAKAARVSAMTRDLSELLPELVPVLKPKLAAAAQAGRLALHPPCTLQHAQKLKGGLEAGLRELGFTVALPADSHLCCGSAGTYSVLQPALSRQLRERKQASLAALAPDTIVSANIGCITHLQAGCATPVRHWVEVLDAALRG